MSHPVIAVTGASGVIGGRVARRLAERGVATRLVGRRAERLPELVGAVKASGAAFGDLDAMRGALAGAEDMLMVSAHESPGRVQDHITAVDAAVAAGVRRIVYVSFLGAAPDATFTFARDHWHTEQYIRGTGLAYTFLRDSLYLSGLAAMAGPDGVIRGPAGNGRVSGVAHDDIADVATAVLLGEEEHHGVTYDVTGPAPLTLTDVAAELSRVTGREITYLPETREEAFASRAGYGAEEWEVTGWVSSYEAIAAGEMAAVADTVPRLTGHEAQSFAAYLDAHPRAYRHLMP
ncbi:NAD(P)H-binding protein [Streptomyces melanogenes]|uniref:NAD(P)H-binding protein n=1 Tax=Streptomyces melanogenes TaxID=67326 RepID=UPI0037BAA7E0